jgi:hypothetical protein
MKSVKILALLVVLAVAVGFAAGWWYRDSHDDSIEHRTKEAAEHMKDAFRSLTHP